MRSGHRWRCMGHMSRARWLASEQLMHGPPFDVLVVNLVRIRANSEVSAVCRCALGFGARVQLPGRWRWQRRALARTWPGMAILSA